MSKSKNLYDVVLEQVGSACKALNLNDSAMQLLKEPVRTLEVSFPVRMDDGTLRVFKGYRCQHNDVLGPTKGGIRFHPLVDMTEVKSLAAWMTYKCSLLGLPYGGGKGGVEVDPRELSRFELEKLARGYMQAIAPIVGDHKDIPAPDMNTDPQIMAWMVDEFAKMKGYNEPGVLTGKPVIFGGSLGRKEATGYGCALTAKLGAEKINLDLNTARVSVQGFGKVGSYTVQYLAQFGAKIVAVADYSCTIYNENGFDIEDLRKYTESNNHVVKGYPGATKELAPEAWLEVDCEILVPAALENQITGDNAHLIKAKIISEGANGPTTPEADEILSQKGVYVLPDILANAGGVTVSYFEWVQNLMNFYWSEEEVVERLDNLMFKAFENVWKTFTDNENITLRKAAFMVSVKRIADAMEVRGWY